LAHLTASVFIGSTSSHLRQTSLVRLPRSVIAINRLLHFVHRVASMGVLVEPQLIDRKSCDERGCRIGRGRIG
jgi:hypothetical protein